MCIHCREVEVAPGFELCPACAVQLRIEVAEGMYRLGRYLKAWAAFSDWQDASASAERR